jgi:tetratricopeptide (TPR) repeat protein
MMDHPNIAKVFDAGATETGRPYFVMELVRGVKITDYCDEQKLSTRERLDLFIRVCQAIQHAHQKGIIHRDIKPSNILVTINDGVPVPKVIDFGIAKATTNQLLTDKTIFTAFEQFVGTPAYMSPEQAMMTSQDIDTRSDIYALGVLLYELLTGKTPFDATELLAIGLDAMRRTICEMEPERPSTRLSIMPHHELGTTALRRSLDAPKLISELRGDLDCVVMMALEKDRARRYETATGLAMDIQRHLKNEPVVARPPGKAYVLTKLVRRHQLAFAAAAIVGFTLVAGMLVSSWYAVRSARAERVAKNERRLADVERTKAQGAEAESKAVNDFLRQDLLRQAGTDTQADEGLKVDPNITLRQVVDRAAERLDNRFTNQPLVEASIRMTLAEIYDVMGDPVAAQHHAERAVELRERILGPDNQLTLAAMTSVCSGLIEAGNPTKAIALGERTLGRLQVVLGREHPDTLRCMNYLGHAYMAAGRFNDAVTLLQETVTLDKSKLGPKNESTLETQNDLGVAYEEAGRLNEAVPLLEETLRAEQSILGQDHPLTLANMGNIAVVYKKAGRLNDSLRLDEETLKLCRIKLGPDHANTLALMNNLAADYQTAGRLNEALALFAEALKLKENKLGPDHPDTLITMRSLASAYQDAGRSADADRVFNDVLTPAFMSQPKSAGVLRARGEFHARFGRWQEAAPDLSHALDLQPDHVWTWHCLAAVLIQEGQLDAYREHCRKSVERFGNTTDPVTAERIAKDCLILPESGADLDSIAKMAHTASSSTNNPSNAAWFQLFQALADYRQGHFTNALDWSDQALTKVGARSERDVAAYMVQAMACQRLNQPDKARAALATGKEIAGAKLPKLDGGDLGGYWLDWVTAQALLREAKALIEGQTPAVKEASK